MIENMAIAIEIFLKIGEWNLNLFKTNSTIANMIENLEIDAKFIFLLIFLTT